MRLILASRQSDLAKIQALHVAEHLRQAWPELQISHHFRESLGDINLTDPLWKMPERGVFTEDFVRGLEDGDFDAVVHSWKDLPTENRPNTEIIATLEREDVRDVLLIRADAPPNKAWRILSSSPRRAENLKNFFAEYLPFPPSQVEFVPVRGNVPRRIAKLHEGEGEGLIVAKAALDRLLGDDLLGRLSPEFLTTQERLREHLRNFWVILLPIELNPPAAAQGALAIEIRKDREDLKEIFAKINSPECFANVQIERQRLRAFGGGCHLKIGVSQLSFYHRGESIGVVQVERGQTPEGESFAQKSFRPQPPRAGLSPSTCDRLRLNPEALVALRSLDVFRAEVSKLNLNQQEELRRSHWHLAHRQAATEQVLSLRPSSQPDSPWIWCSGLESWKKLARLGLWVRGCDENRGRTSSLASSLRHLADPAYEWIKLTHPHSKTYHYSDQKKFATYANVRREDVDLRDKLKNGICFYWHSGQLLEEALNLCPEIRERDHACGLGQTFERAEELLGRDLRGRAFLSETEWREWCLQQIR